MKEQNFTYSFLSSETPEVIFDLLLNVDQWWSGFYGETTEGKTHQVTDEFSFRAGGGAHQSKQKLTELIPNKRVAWQVIASNLSFLTDSTEWLGSSFFFDITPEGDKVRVTFTHQGLVPELECYESCSGGWTKYLNALKNRLS